MPLRQLGLDLDLVVVTSITPHHPPISLFLNSAATQDPDFIAGYFTTCLLLTSILTNTGRNNEHWEEVAERGGLVYGFGDSIVGGISEHFEG